MLDVAQFRNLIVDPSLKAIGCYSLSASNLVMGTAAQESRFRYLKQLGTGPALGLFQMEPATHDDIWQNYLEHRDEFAGKVLTAIDCAGQPGAERLVWDLRYAAIMCRVHYRRVPAPLPGATDPEALGRYWKKWYNSELGHGTVDQFIESYKLTN